MDRFLPPGIKILLGTSDVEVACQPSKLDSRVQFPAGAYIYIFSIYIYEFID